MGQQCLTDFVKHLVASLYHNHVSMPFENERPWHELFYELRRQGEKPVFIEKLRFDWDGPYPHSRELSDFLHALHWNASVSANNPSFSEISLSDDIASLWTEEASELDAKDKSFLELTTKMAKAKFEQPKAC